MTIPILTTTLVLDLPYGPHVPDPLTEGDGRTQAASVDRAVQRFTEDRARLYRSSDGQAVYGAAEMREREAALLEAFDREARRIAEEAQRTLTEAEQVLVQLTGSDPIDTLTEAERARANSLRAFVVEEAAELPLVQLVPRLRAALVTKDRAALTLWARYAGKRLDVEHRQPSAASSQDRAALATLVRELQGAVADPTAQTKREQALRRIQTARAVDMHLRRQRGELDGSRAQALNDARRHIRSAF